MSLTTLLCFDYGSKRIGVAVGCALVPTASPLVTVNAKDDHPDWDKIKQLIDEWQPDALIVGLPINLKCETQEITVAARKFMRRLHGRFKLPVFEVDEYLSSREAIRRTGKTTGLDPVAAQVILETWLTEHQAKK